MSIFGKTFSLNDHSGIYVPTHEEELIIENPIPFENMELTLSKMKNYKPDKGDILVNGNINAIDNLWKNGNYINPKAIGENKSTVQKYINSKKDIINGKVEIPPILYLDSSEPSIEFENGRNRFSNIRDSGIITMPIVIPKRQLSEFKKLKLIIIQSAGKIYKKGQKTRKRFRIKNYNI
jgi:hypothetical protein